MYKRSNTYDPLQMILETSTSVYEFANFIFSKLQQATRREAKFCGYLEENRKWRLSKSERSRGKVFETTAQRNRKESDAR